MPADTIRLNKEQEALRDEKNGPILCVASAGTGKTETIVQRLVHLINNGVDPYNILLLTFTNKAGREMKERAMERAGRELTDLTACTYHTFCARLLRIYGSLAGVGNDFSIISPSNARLLVNSIIAEKTKDIKDKYTAETGRRYEGKIKTPSAITILNIYSTSINRRIPIADIIAGFYPTMGIDLLGIPETALEFVNNIIDRYEEEKKKQNILDYDDLLTKTVDLFKNHPEICRKLSERYHYIMVDEFQDTNFAQYEIVKRLRQFGNDNICVVGDDGQTIYTWRGSAVDNIFNFPDDFPGTKVMMLNENYRSSQEILDLGNYIINQAERKYDKHMHGQYQAGFKPTLIRYSTNYQEAEDVVAMIDNYRHMGYNLSDMAVLVRNANDSITLESNLLKNQRQYPYRKFGGLKFTEREVCQDMIAFLNVIDNTKTPVYWMRTLMLYQGVGEVWGRRIAGAILDRGLEALDGKTYHSHKISAALYDFKRDIARARAKGSPYEKLQTFMPVYKELKTKALEKYQNYNELKNNLDEEIRALETFAEEIKNYRSLKSYLDDLLLEATEEKEDLGDFLTISTVHSAKGLEWPVVFLLSCTDSSYPGERRMNSMTDLAKREAKEQLEESRRLLYVAVTRARKDLIICCPEDIFLMGVQSQTVPSRFLPPLSSELLNVIDERYSSRRRF